MTRPSSHKNAGFTLVELLIVIAIIGLLAAVVLVNLNGARIRARETKRKADLRQLATAVQLYYEVNGSWPDNSTTITGDWDANFKPQMAPYLNRPPLDPLANAAGRYYAAYRMTWASDANCNGKYVLWFYYEGTTDPDYGKYTCGFGDQHYFIVLGPY